MEIEQCALLPNGHPIFLSPLLSSFILLSVFLEAESTQNANCEWPFPSSRSASTPITHSSRTTSSGRKLSSPAATTTFFPSLHPEVRFSYTSRSIFSRKKKKRSGSRRFARLVLKLIPIIASNLKVPPRPLHLIAEELGGGDGSGGGPGFWGGGSGWGWFDGWRRGGGRRKFGFWAILVACGLSLLLVGETESLGVCRILGLGLFGLGLVEGWSKKKGTTVVRNGVLGICFLGAVSFWGLRKEEVQGKSWVQELALRRQIRRRRGPGKFW